MNLVEIEKLVELLERINSVSGSGTSVGRHYETDQAGTAVADKIKQAVKQMSVNKDADDNIPF